MQDTILKIVLCLGFPWNYLFTKKTRYFCGIEYAISFTINSLYGMIANFLIIIFILLLR